jgi:tetratricopeptide (TPR) repeat protein
MGNEFEMITGLSNLALALIELEAYDEARTQLEQAQQIQEHLGYCPQLTTVLTNLGIVANLQGQHGEAEAHFNEGMHGKHGLDNEEKTAFSLIHLGQSYLGLHQYERARDRFMDTLELTQKVSLPALALMAVMGLAEVKAVVGQPEEALQLLQLPLHHPAAGQQTRQSAQALITDIEGKLESQVWGTAETGSPILSLEEVTTLLLAE